MAAKKNVKVKDRPDLVRDSFSKAIINVDRNSFAQYKARKNSLKEKDRKIASLENEVNEMRAKQDEILALLKSLDK
jgi:flagellar basal body P-ring protein FlgI